MTVEADGYVGLGNEEYDLTLNGLMLTPDLNATYTVGHKYMDQHGHLSGDRFGDPHAIYNRQRRNLVQVAAFAGAASGDMVEFAYAANLMGIARPQFAQLAFNN